MNKLILAVIVGALIVSVPLHYFSEPSEKDMFDKVAPSVHSINVVKDGTNESRNFCTGFNVESEGRIYSLTNKHCCEAIERMQPMAVFENAKFRMGTKYINGYVKDENSDICMLKLSGFQGQFLRLSKKAPEVADIDYITGFASGHPKRTTKGLILGTQAGYILDVFMPYITSAHAEGGNSGSPVTNTKGDVIGILYAGSNVSETNYVVPLWQVKRFLKQVSEYEKDSSH